MIKETLGPPQEPTPERVGEEFNGLRIVKGGWFGASMPTNESPVESKYVKFDSSEIDNVVNPSENYPYREAFDMLKQEFGDTVQIIGFLNYRQPMPIAMIRYNSPNPDENPQHLPEDTPRIVLIQAIAYGERTGTTEENVEFSEGKGYYLYGYPVAKKGELSYIDSKNFQVLPIGNDATRVFHSANLVNG